MHLHILFKIRDRWRRCLNGFYFHLSINTTISMIISGVFVGKNILTRLYHRRTIFIQSHTILHLLNLCLLQLLFSFKHSKFDLLPFKICLMCWHCILLLENTRWLIPLHKLFLLFCIWAILVMIHLAVISFVWVLMWIPPWPSPFCFRGRLNIH